MPYAGLISTGIGWLRVFPTGEVAATFACRAATAASSASASRWTATRMAENPGCPSVRPRKACRSRSPSRSMRRSRIAMPAAEALAA
jgi:hypothetical protein